MIFKRLRFVFIFILSISACSSDSQQENPKSGAQSRDLPETNYVIKETFNVGRDVFVRAMSVDSTSENLWVGTSVGALQINLKDGDVKQTFTRDNGLANEYVFATFVDSKENVWFGTNGGGISRYQSGDWKSFFPMHGLADYWVYSFAEQTSQALWIGTWAGLNRYDYRTGKFETYLKELVNEWVYGLDVDSKNHLWVGTEGGVNMYDGSKWHVWTNDDGVGADNSQQLPFSANTGLGTRSRHNLSVLVNGEESYNPNYIFCVKVAGDDSVWVGTWGGGVSFFNGKNWQNLTKADGLAGNIVYSIAIDSEGVFWFGTNNGVSRYDGSHWQAFGKAEGLLDSHVYSLVSTKMGKIWAGTRHGVSVIEKL